MTGPVHKSSAAAAFALMGFTLPLSLLLRLVFFSWFMNPFEILQVFGASWLIHVPIAVAAAGIAAILALPLRNTRFGNSLPSIILVSGFFFSVWPVANQWLGNHLKIQPSPFVVAACLAALGVLAGFRHPKLEQNALPVARLLTLGGGSLALLTLILGLWPEQKPARPAPDRSRPDMLIITLDAFANRHMSANNYPRPTTPGLDKLAATGVYFTRLVASSNFTTPTINSFLTGQSSLRHGAWQLPSRPLARFVNVALPARLYAMGYSVRAVTTNPWGGVFKNGYGRWFDAVETDAIPKVSGCDGLSRWLPYVCAGAGVGVIDALVERVNVLLDWAGWWERGRHYDSRQGLVVADHLFRRDVEGRPVALWVHLLPPHDPYVAPRPFLGLFDPSPRMRSMRTTTPPYLFTATESPQDRALLMARYDESIASVDADITHFIDRLRNDGRLNGTILMISADHGESFATDYGGHSGPKLDDDLIRVPLIIRAPGLPTGRRIDMPVSQIDLAPTLLALAGATTPGDMEGRSLLPVIAGDANAIPVFAYSLESANRSRRPSVGSAAMIDGQWKYVHYWNQPDLPGFRDLVDSLYDLSNDPGESRNLVAQEPRRTAMMLTEIQRRIDRQSPVALSK